MCSEAELMGSPSSSLPLLPMASAPLLVLLLSPLLPSSSAADPHPPPALSSCLPLSPTFRLRWALLPQSIEIALEATVPSDHSLALGWAAPPSSSFLHAGVSVVGFEEDGAPFIEDYTITCHAASAVSTGGVAARLCSGLVFEAFNASVSNVELVFARRKGGVSFFQYRRPLASPDRKYDFSVNLSQNVIVMWASGLIRLPDSENHVISLINTFEHLTLNVSEVFDYCLEPLEREEHWLPVENGAAPVRFLVQEEKDTTSHVDLLEGLNNSVALDDQQVTFFWKLSKGSISVAARAERRSGYLAIGFGDGMANCFAYVGWVQDDGACRLSSYWIDGRNSTSVHPTSENLTNARCQSLNGIISLGFTRHLSPSCSGRIECENFIDPMKPLKVVWALGAQWSGGHLSELNKHSVASDSPEPVLLLHRLAEAEQGMRQVLAVHGFLMFVAWAILFPSGILAARFFKHLNGDWWFKFHVYLQCSGFAVAIVAFLLAAAELGGIFVSSSHAKFGVAAIIMVSLQLINGYLRPKRPASGVVVPNSRMIWEYTHVIIGRTVAIAGVVALFSGLKHFGVTHDSEIAERLTWALVLWILIGVSLVLYLEHLELKRRIHIRNSFGSSWNLGNNNDGELENLLYQNRTISQLNSQPFGGVEVQLENLSK